MNRRIERKPMKANKQSGEKGCKLRCEYCEQSWCTSICVVLINISVSEGTKEKCILCLRMLQGL